MIPNYASSIFNSFLSQFTFNMNKMTVLYYTYIIYLFSQYLLTGLADYFYLD